MEIDPSLVGTILGVIVTFFLGLLTFMANRNKDKNNGRFAEVDRLRDDLNERDQAYRNLVKEIHILNAWIFVLVKQLRDNSIEPADRPDHFATQAEEETT